MNKIILIFIVIGILLIEGCNTDKTFSLELWVKNNLNETITVSITNYLDEQIAEVKDTTFVIPANDSMSIHLENPIGNSMDLYSQNFPLFDSIEIAKADGTLSPKEFAVREEWDFKRIHDDAAIYTLSIDESDF